MVSRTDPKPLYYLATAQHLFRPLAVAGYTRVLDNLKTKLVTIKEIPPDIYLLEEKIKYLENETLAGDYICENIAAECERGTDPYSNVNCTAAFLAKQFSSRKGIIRDKVLNNNIAKVISTLCESATRIYHGSEAAVKLVNVALEGKLVKSNPTSENVRWAALSAVNAVTLQASSCMQNPDAINILTHDHVIKNERIISEAFEIFSHSEKLIYRSGNRRIYDSHLHYANKRVLGFVESENICDDFKCTIPHMAEMDVDVYKVIGLTIVRVADRLYVLSVDDAISFCKMIRSHFNSVVYFAIREAKGGCIVSRAVTASKTLFLHLSERIDGKQYYGATLRALNLYNMALFSDLEETDVTTGYKERSTKIYEEAYALDEKLDRVINAIKALKMNDYDELNVMFLYHMVVGDDAGVDDLIKKLKAAPAKVEKYKYDPAYYDEFLNFFKTYMLARFMKVNRRIPSTKGDPISEDQPWVAKCLRGKLVLPPESAFGKTYISGEFTFNEYIRFWSLEAGDVTLILNQPEKYLKQNTKIEAELSNELLYTMKYGRDMDYETKRTPEQTLENLYSGVAREHTVLVAAAKNENAKHSEKKRATFSADHEFRKVQAMFDKNIHTMCDLIPGGSLGLTHRAAEKKFAKIAHNTILDKKTLNTSQDVSAWSESQEREKFFKFAQVIIEMSDKVEALNIKQWWSVILVCFNKMGTSLSIKMPDGSFQGMPGRQDTVEHASLLLFFVHKARTTRKIPQSVKVLHNTCIDDCIASFIGAENPLGAKSTFDLLDSHYRKLGYELDYIKSIVSYIKGIFCSRRFCKGIEIAADFKTILKMGVSYDATFHSPMNVVHDHLSSALGAANMGGVALDIYFQALFAGYATLSLYAPPVLKISPDRVAVYSMICKDDLGWGIPDIIQWCTKDVIDTRTRSNCIFQSAAEAVHTGFCQTGFTESQARTWGSVKVLGWKSSSAMSMMKSPFTCRKDGPMSANELIRITVRPYLREYIKDKGWASMFDQDESDSLHEIISVFMHGGIVDATIIGALSDCMPWSFIQSIEGKAFSSSVVLRAIPQSVRYSLQRRVAQIGIKELMYLEDMVLDSNHVMTREEIASIEPHGFTVGERNAFFTFNNVECINHTYADPISSFTQISRDFKSHIRYDPANFRSLRKTLNGKDDVKCTRGMSGLYIPAKSMNVLEYTNKRFDSWDPVTKKIIAGLVILGVASDEGHNVDGLSKLFISLWDTYGSVDLSSPILASTRGSSKRLAQNPGSLTHPIFIHRNLSQSIVVNLTTAIAALPATGHMHDVLGSIIALRACGTLTAALCIELGAPSFTFNIGLRSQMVIRKDCRKMQTAYLSEHIDFAIENSAIPWGFAQQNPDLADRVRLITMPAVTALYLKSMFVEKRFDYSRIMNECKNYIKTVREENMSIQWAIYPSELKPRGQVIASSKLFVKDPLALMMKGRPDSVSEERDTYSEGTEKIKYKMLSAAVPVTADARSLVNVIRTSLIFEFNTLPVADIAAAASKEPAYSERVKSAILSDRMWTRVIASSKTLFKEEDEPIIWHNALAKIGCPGFRNEGNISIQAIKSFIGNYVSNMAQLALPEYARIVGTQSGHFKHKPALVILAADADRINKRKRLAALELARKNYIRTLSVRIDAIENNTISHWNDATVIDHDAGPDRRLTILRIRKMITKAVSYTPDVRVDEPALSERLSKELVKVQQNIIARHHMKLKPIIFDKDALLSHKCRETFISIEEHLDTSSKNHGFKGDLGYSTYKQMIKWFSGDAYRESKTIYAVTPGNVQARASHISVAPLLETETNVWSTLPLEIKAELELEGEKMGTAELSPETSDDDANVDSPPKITLTDVNKVPEHEVEITLTSGASLQQDQGMPEDLDEGPLLTKKWKPMDMRSEAEIEQEYYRNRQIKEIENLKKAEAAGASTAQTKIVTQMQKDLMTSLLNHTVANDVCYLAIGYAGKELDEIDLFRRIDPFNRSDAWITEKFGAIAFNAQQAEEPWDDSYLTILDDDPDGDDVGEEV